MRWTIPFTWCCVIKYYCYITLILQGNISDEIVQIVWIIVKPTKNNIP